MPRPGPKPTVDNFSTIQIQITPAAHQEFRDREASQQFHKSVRLLGPYYPTIDLGRNSVSPSSRPQTFQPHIADRTRFPNPTKKELLELEKLELEKLVRFCRAPSGLRRPAKKSILPSACILDMLDNQIPPIFPFSDLPIDIRLMIFDELDAPKPRDVHVALVNIVPRGAYGFKLYYKPVNTTVPVILQICRESRSLGLTRYKPAFKNVDQDGNVEDQIYVNPKLDTIILELPIEIMRYPRIKPFTPKPSPWTDETHKLFRCTNFKFAHCDPWAGIEDLDDAFGYDYRFKSYLVIVPKGRAAGWVEKVDMEGMKPTTGIYTCTMIGPVILPPYTDRTPAALPGSWYDYTTNFVEGLENDPLVMKRPLGNSPHRFWDS